MDSFNRLLNSLGDFLKKRGFKKRGKLTWQLVLNDNLALISLQSNVSESGFVRLTVNLGVVSKKLVQVLKGIDFFHKGEPGLSEQAVQTRLGMLMPEKSDLWWEVTEDNVNSVTEVIESALIGYGLPYLEDKSKDGNLLEHWLWVFKNYPDVPNYQVMRFIAVLLYSQGRSNELREVVSVIKKTQSDIPGIDLLFAYLGCA